VEPLTTTLTREGDQVTGRFRTECCEGVITGRVLGNALIYDWQTPNARGQAFATIQDDGTIFGILGIAVSVFGGGDWRVRRAP
jgi:hypothetical protein